MSDEMDFVDGRAMFLGRVPAWHRLGYVHGDHFGEPEIMAQAPELLSDVRKETPYVFTSEGVTPLHKTCAIVREADSRIVGEGVGIDTYGIVQPRDVFAFGQELAGLEGYPLESAGAIREGSQFFFTYRTGESGEGDFKLNHNLSMVSSHDGSLQCMALYSTTIIVCANTLALALRTSADRIVFRHTAFVADRMAAFLDARKGVEDYQAEVQGQLADLANRTIVTRQFDLVLDGVLPKMDEEGPAATRRATAREAIRTLYSAPVVGDLQGTALGVVQAFNTYENWSAPVRGKKGVAGDTLRATRQFDAMVKGNQPLTQAAVDALGPLWGIEFA